MPQKCPSFSFWKSNSPIFCWGWEGWLPGVIAESRSRNGIAYQTTLMASSLFYPPHLSPPPAAPPFPKVTGTAFCGCSSVKCVVSQLIFLLPGYNLAFVGLLSHLFIHPLSVFRDFVVLLSSPHGFMSKSILMCFSGLSWESETICMFSICHLNLKPWLFKMFYLCLTSWDLKRLLKLAFFISFGFYVRIYNMWSSLCGLLETLMSSRIYNWIQNLWIKRLIVF